MTEGILVLFGILFSGPGRGSVYRTQVDEVVQKNVTCRSMAYPGPEIFYSSRKIMF